MKRSFSQSNLVETVDSSTTSEQELKLYKQSSDQSFDLSILQSTTTTSIESEVFNSTSTIIILDDSISSELLKVKYTSDSFIILYLSNFETLLSTHEIKHVLKDETLSNCIERITNMYIIHPNQTNFKFLSIINEPQVILYWINKIQKEQRGVILKKAFPYISTRVKQNEHVVRKLVEYCCDLMINELDIINDSLVMLMFDNCVNKQLLCNKLTMNQILMCIKTNHIDFLPYVPVSIVNDKQFWLQCFENHCKCFKYESVKKYIEYYDDKKFIYNLLSKELQNDIDICCEIVKHGELPIWLSEDMKTNRNVLLQALKSKIYNSHDCNRYKYYENLPQELKQDKEFLLEIIIMNLHLFLKYNIYNDKEFLTQSIKKSHWLLYKYLPKDIRDDKEMVINLLKEEYISDHLLDHLYNKDTILENLSEELYNDKQFILEIIKIYPKSFNYASEILRNDPEIYNQVLNEECFGTVYFNLPKHLQTNVNLMLKYISKNSFIIPPENINMNVRNNKEIMMKLLQISKGIYNYASNELKLDKEFILNALKYDNEIIIDLDYWKNDKEIILGINNINLEHVSEELRNNFNIALSAVIGNIENLEFISNDLLNDIKFIEELLQNEYILRWNGYRIINKLPKNILENKEYVKIICKYTTNYNIFQYLNSDFEFMLSFIDVLNPFRYASRELKSNNEFFVKVVTKYPDSYVFFPTDWIRKRGFALKFIRWIQKNSAFLGDTFCYRDFFDYCDQNPKEIVKIIKKFPQLVNYLFSSFYWYRIIGPSKEPFFREISFINFECFKQYLIVYPQKLQQHQTLLREHARLKCCEKFNHSNLTCKIWKLCDLDLQ